MVGTIVSVYMNFHSAVGVVLDLVGLSVSVFVGEFVGELVVVCGVLELAGCSASPPLPL